MERGLVKSLGQINLYMTYLKKTRHGCVTNIFDFEGLENKIRNKEVIFEYREKSYLNLLCEESGFYRLFFFIADLDNYFLEQIESTVVCDVVILQESEAFGKLKDKFFSNGFVQYDCIGKWVLRSFDKIPLTSKKGYIFNYDKKLNAVAEIFNIFDRYTDCLPEKNDVNIFLKDKRFINAYEINGNEYVGSLIFTEKRKMAILEYFFVLEKFRGRGISYLLHDHFYQLVAKEEFKVISYIRETNVMSIRVHEKYGYQKEQFEKFIFIKSMNN